MNEKTNDINNNMENNTLVNESIQNNVSNIGNGETQNALVNETVQTSNNNEISEQTDEKQEMIDKNKRVISASPQMVDSSSINVNQTTSQPESETNIVSETIIDTDLNNLVFEEEEKAGSFEEVSLSLDSSSLDINEDEINPNSVFNKIETNEQNGVETTKIGEEKHKFPFFMLFIFIIVIVLAFNIETVTEIINKYLNKTEPVEEEKEEPKKKEILLNDIIIELNKSEIISSFKNSKNVEVAINLDESNNSLSFTTSNYLKLSASDTITVTFNKEESDLVTTCTDETMEFCEVVTTATVLSISKIEGTYSEELETYLKENIVFGAINIDGFSETPISEGRIFRISLLNNISLPNEIK